MANLEKFSEKEIDLVDSVDINTASAEEIADTLQGIGLARAKAIIDYREANGPFKSPEDLVNVQGVGGGESG